MTDLTTIEEKIRELMQREYRKDTEFRYLIVSTEIGDIGKYITHDPALNPSARPHGSKVDEILAYGQALVQLIALAQLRDMKLASALESGLNNWIESDWRKTETRDSSDITGRTVFNGYVKGEAYVAISRAELEAMPPGKILVTQFGKPDLASYTDKVVAVVTDHGGIACHLANIALERGIVSIVGTGNATELIRTGDKIIVDAQEEQGHVYVERHL
jgi:phosphohistidine swiveling domain-containing protein